ncbi:MAG: DUF6800 family protein [Pirellulales bacterium]
MGGISERAKEIKRRRKRREKLGKFHKKLGKATASDKLTIAQKIREMTPGAEVILNNWGINER